jgi:protein-disulfide isomerase
LITAKSNITEANVAQILTDAGIDADRAARDLATNAKAIDAVLARSDTQAKAFGFQGTPAFIIGKFRVPGALSVANFKQAIKDARAALKKT